MLPIDDLNRRAKEFQKGLETGKFLENILLDNEAFIVNLNAEDQLFDHGINALGVSISDYMPYSPLTIEIKKEKGQPTNRVTLKDEGDFEGSFYVDVGKDSFEIKAADFKTHDLMTKYGRQILGLTDENMQELINEIIRPDLIKQRDSLLYGKKS
jgi:hypothetical protein